MPDEEWHEMPLETGFLSSQKGAGPIKIDLKPVFSVDFCFVGALHGFAGGLPGRLMPWGEFQGGGAAGIFKRVFPREFS